MSRNYFRPHVEPAGAIYDALIDEATHRKERQCDEWISKERERVWSTARDCAQKLGKPVPTMAEVEREERSAQGHCDYAAKWAIGVHFLILREAPMADSRAVSGPSSRFDQAEANRDGPKPSRAVSAQLRAKSVDAGNGGAE